MFQELSELYNALTLGVTFRIALTIVVGLALVVFLRRLTRKWVSMYATHHITVVVTSIVWYTGLILIITTIMHEMGFHFTTLLGAAGIFGIAMGFAAQTSLSNIISGIFLLGEHSFQVGDFINFEQVSGTVESISLLSIGLRTRDNTFIRIPNETLLKNLFINWSAYPQIRLVLKIRISSTASIESAQKIINESIENSALILKDPLPRVALAGTTYWSSEMVAKVWVSTDDYTAAKEQLIRQIKQRADEQKISMAISHNK